MLEYRKRVATYIDGDTTSYEDTNFVVGDSGAVLNMFGDAEKEAHIGYFVNDGPGDIKIELSSNGSTYGGQHLPRGGDILDLDDLRIKKVRLTHVDDTEYRCMLG